MVSRADSAPIQAREVQSPQAESDANGILDMLIEVAQVEIDRQLTTSDGHDVKGLGLLAANVAAVGLAIAFSPRWINWWLIPIAIAVVSFGSYLYLLRGRSYNVGPVVREFYERHGAITLVEARRHLLAQLIRAIDNNNKILPEKRLAFTIGTLAMLAEVAIGAGVLRMVI